MDVCLHIKLILVLILVFRLHIKSLNNFSYSLSTVTKLSHCFYVVVRIQKVETSLRKRVSWIDGRKGVDDGIREFSPRYQDFSAKQSPITPTTANCGTQYEPDLNVQPDDAVKNEIESVTSSISSRQKSASKTKRESMAIRPINITFPFPVTPDKFRSELNQAHGRKSGNAFLICDHQKNLLNSMTPRRSQKYN